MEDLRRNLRNLAPRLVVEAETVVAMRALKGAAAAACAAEARRRRAGRAAERRDAASDALGLP